MTRALGEMMILLSVAVIVAVAYNAVSPRGIPLFGDWNPSQGVPSAGGRCKPSETDVPESKISTLFEAPGTVFVDARSAEDYMAGHIPGAISLPVGEFEEMFPDFASRYPPDTRIVTYCSGRDCYDSHDLAEMLREQGYENVSVYSRGFSGWISEKRPVKTGMEP